MKLQHEVYHNIFDINSLPTELQSSRKRQSKPKRQKELKPEPMGVLNEAFPPDFRLSRDTFLPDFRESDGIFPPPFTLLPFEEVLLFSSRKPVESE